MKFQEGKNKELARLEELYLDGLKKAGVFTFNGRAKLLGDFKLQINSAEVISSQNIIIATGGRPLREIFRAQILEYLQMKFLISKHCPEIVIVGGGYIACEFATIFNGLCKGYISS